MRAGMPTVVDGRPSCTPVVFTTVIVLTRHERMPPSCTSVMRAVTLDAHRSYTLVMLVIIFVVMHTRPVDRHALLRTPVMHGVLITRHTDLSCSLTPSYSPSRLTHLSMAVMSPLHPPRGAYQPPPSPPSM